MRRLGASHDLIVCVDCGTLSHEPIAAAGCDVIVLDHHLGAETLPPALAVVNPNRQDEDGALGYLCAAGVVFLMLVAVNRLMRAEGAAGPDLLGFLDLVALATVADVAPLVGLNRALVRQGLAVMARRRPPGPRRARRGRRADRRAERLGRSASCSGRGSTPAAGSAPPTSGRGCSPPTTRTRRRRSPSGSHRLNAERRDIEAAVLAAAEAQAAARGADGAAGLGRRRRAGIRASSASSRRG